MKLLLKYPFVLLLLLVVMVGCKQAGTEDPKEPTPEETTQVEVEEVDPAKEEPEETEPVEEPEVVEVEPLPSTYEELASQPIGEHVDFAAVNNDELTVETFKDLPDISNTPSEQQMDLYYRELLRMVQKEFKGPEELMKRLRFDLMGSPDIEDSRYQFKENLNVEIILDASGSMAAQAGGKVKMDAAKDSIISFVDQLPEDAKVSLRIYGHKGTGNNADKALSCKSSELVYPMTSYNQANFQDALNKVKPAGWTPIELAINEAKKDLEKFDGASNTNIIYLVSDGVSTCDDDPVKAAKELYDSNISPIINVIGFDVDSEGQNQLIKIAEATDGIYQKVNDESELKNELNKINELAEAWESWKKQSEQQLEYKKVNNNLDIFVYIGGESYNATFEKLEIENILYTLKRNDVMDGDALNYLLDRNRTYHAWITEEIEKFKVELQNLNEKSYSEAKKALDEKYQSNTLD
ncbi:vWA domain-containing protein [Bacillus sp. PS06]|uniref:vWA domain-containing protein n=1 Tax=Bacillus sp. PS06 TaxID=2764176 RepID=UPI00177D1A59|nr:VWA domain-containing protein [Bacillus sp. PS06]MBD8071135.1 VWA domain-containing protein [Bacillus sp. PS06]